MNLYTPRRERLFYRTLYAMAVIGALLGILGIVVHGADGGNIAIVAMNLYIVRSARNSLLDRAR